MFDKFSKAFPPEDTWYAPVDSKKLIDFVEGELGVAVPTELKLFWENQGSGYFGERILYFFGDGLREQPRDSFAEWNKKDFWRSVYPPPREGGPVFFAETCFGDQIGYRWEKDRTIFILFCVDTFEAFSIAKSGTELFETILGNRYALLDENRYAAVLNALGPLKLGMHYAPLVSPMLGGGGDVGNICFETPNVHFRTSIATFNTKNPTA